MARLNVNPTRMELGRLKTAYSSAMRGHKLLKDKRDELMRRLIETAKEAHELRANIEEELKRTGKNLRLAQAVMGREELKTALMGSNTGSRVRVESVRVMSVVMPVFSMPEKRADIVYGYAHTDSRLDRAVEGILGLSDKLLRLAQLEKVLELMGEESERVRRRVNALEHIMLPDYRETIKYITMKLEENERAASIRLLKVKEMYK